MTKKDFQGYSVRIPWCQHPDVGYNNTLVSEQLQRKVYYTYYKKNLTGNPAEDSLYSNGTLIYHWEWIVRRYYRCSKTLRKAACGHHMVPPFFKEEGLGLYTLCRSGCRHILTECPEIVKDPEFDFHYWLVQDCGMLAYGVSSHGFCEHKTWPNPHEWLNSLKTLYGGR